MITALAKKLDEPENMYRLKAGMAAVAGVAAAYGMGRVIVKRRASERQYRRRMERWLSSRIGELSAALGLMDEVSERFTQEVRQACRASMKYIAKARKSKEGLRGAMRAAFEKRMMKMKKRVSDILNITESAQEQMMHKFYKDLRHWLIPV